MEQAILAEKLSAFGLGRQEAVIYLCLLQNGALTGYEAAKLTGISRSNVYNGLASLTDHGAAYMLEGTVTKYLAVELAEFCDNRIRYLKRQKDELLHNVPSLRQSAEGYITITGYRHIYDKIYHMLSEASKRIYFAGDGSFLERWETELLRLMERRIKVVLISDKVPDGLAGAFACKKFTFYRTLSPAGSFLPEENAQDEPKRKGQIRLIIDSAFVLTGEVRGTAADNCLYTAEENFVSVFKEAMRNEIKLIEISEKNALEGR